MSLLNLGLIEKYISNNQIKKRDTNGKPFTDTVDVPYRWTEALCSGLAAKLAVKKRPELLTVLAPLADKAFENASTDERERVSLRINPA